MCQIWYIFNSKFLKRESVNLLILLQGQVVYDDVNFSVIWKGEILPSSNTHIYHELRNFPFRPTNSNIRTQSCTGVHVYEEIESPSWKQRFLNLCLTNKKIDNGPTSSSDYVPYLSVSPEYIFLSQQSLSLPEIVPISLSF